MNKDQEKIQQDMAIGMKIMNDNMPALIEKMRIDSILHRHKYQQLIEQGFNEAQALELCKHTI